MPFNRSFEPHHPHEALTVGFLGEQDHQVLGHMDNFSGHPSQHLALNLDGLQFCNDAAGHGQVSAEYLMADWDPNNCDPAEFAQKHEKPSEIDLSFANHVSGNPFVKTEYGDQSPGHRLLNGQIGAINPVHVFGGIPTPYLLSPDIDYNPVDYFQTALSNPSLASQTESVSDCFGPASAEAVPVEEKSPVQSTEHGQDAPGEASTRKKRSRPKLGRSRAGGGRYERARMPHNEVERKYRESLNIWFEKLRASIPTLPENDPANGPTVQKQSKATVLGAAIEYIEHLEAEVERIKGENTSLRSNRKSGGSKRHSSKRGA